MMDSQDMRALPKKVRVAGYRKALRDVALKSRKGGWIAATHVS